MGEATGIIKAQLADKVAGIINKRGSICKALDASAITGKIRFVIAVFEVISVKKVSTKDTEKTPVLHRVAVPHIVDNLAPRVTTVKASRSKDPKKP